jgi:hypothetical protein
VPLYATTELPGSSGAGTNLFGQESDDVAHLTHGLQIFGVELDHLWDDFFSNGTLDH